ncbi:MULTISPECIES: Fic family protein [unclassified Actinobaculum]|uniref:Fic family protein n=1 Tax=unclassified Actinobaculum TaxID=2609299 RepID=UPI000D526058|nr:MULTISPECIES: hypothetical protein [unclassified Actinobaculum]AWE42794.1 hypothetical protein DDD63_08600 [Actinobaculum sp. 313]RTE49603.1 hypothetical protein EKN07_06045 [Actinobaculum sp. 352]
MFKAALNGPVRRNDLLVAAGLGRLAQDYTRPVISLLNGGPLELTIPDEPRSKNQRYRVAGSGRDFLRQWEGGE